jgi:ribosome-associated protein
MADIVVNPRVTVPEEAIETKAVRSGGPGGQNVNKLATKIQMRVDLDRVLGLHPDERARLKAFLASRLDADGRLYVSSQETRDQARNRADCADKVAELIRAGLVRPKVRRATRPTRSSKLSRVEAKRRHSDRLRDRRVDD